jgi:hypothetical protein
VKYHIIVSDDVQSQLEILIEEAEMNRRGRGAVFLRDYKRALKLIRDFPFAFPLKSADYRVIQFEHFEYLLVYRIISKDVIVARLVHSRSGFERMFGATA